MYEQKKTEIKFSQPDKVLKICLEWALRKQFNFGVRPNLISIKCLIS